MSTLFDVECDEYILKIMDGFLNELSDEDLEFDKETKKLLCELTSDYSLD